MKVKSTKNNISAVVMLLEGINMFVHRGDRMLNTGPINTSLKATLQNNHDNLGKSRKAQYLL